MTASAPEPNSVVVVGAGPAGLRAAEVAAAAGARVLVCDAQGSAGRKFLVAGRGGLNLTHSESVENFPARYREAPERWRDLLAEFGPDALRAWAEELEIETYVGTSRRVFPRGQKAAALLRAWLRRLREAGVEFRTGARLRSLTNDGDRWRLAFADGEEIVARAVVLALGGASWPETGSDGAWPPLLAAHGVKLAPFVAANCGWNVGLAGRGAGTRGGFAAQEPERERRRRNGLGRIVDHARRTRGRRDLPARTRLAGDDATRIANRFQTAGHGRSLARTGCATARA